MKNDIRQQIALFRYGILAPLISDMLDPSVSKMTFFREASKKTYTSPYGTDTTVSAVTIRRWYYNYQKNGFDGLLPQKRCDTGHSRKLDDDLKEQIKHLKQEYPRLPATLIHQKLFDNGSIKNNEVSLSTVTRYINQLNIQQRTATGDEMKRYERAHINTVWYGDSSIGLYLKIDGKKKKVWLIALLDDASRMIVGIDAFFHDNYLNVMSVMKSAITKFGKPKVLTFDNGTPYKNKQMTLLAARIGISLNYNAPYTPQGKAKIERWFSTLKQQWMSGLNIDNFSSLDDLRHSLQVYVRCYNQRSHSSLDNTSPMDRFFSESHLIKRLSNNQLENSFLLEIERRV